MTFLEAKKILNKNGFKIIREYRENDPDFTRKSEEQIKSMFDDAYNFLVDGIDFYIGSADFSEVRETDMGAYMACNIELSDEGRPEYINELFIDRISEYEYNNPDVRITIMNRNLEEGVFNIRFSTDIEDYDA